LTSALPQEKRNTPVYWWNTDHESGHPQWQMSIWQPSTTWAFANDREWIQEFCRRMG
jgi:hypothetical protein